MLEKWRYRRGIEKKIDSLDKQVYQAISAEWPDYSNNPLDLLSKRKLYQGKLDYLETRKLVRKADRLGIDVTYEQNPQWWYKLSEKGFWMLTLSGQTRARKLIREELLSRSKRWGEILVPILSLLVALAALLKPC